MAKGPKSSAAVLLPEGHSSNFATSLGSATPNLDTGDPVAVVCWRPFALSDDPGAGEWTVVTGRVVSVRADGTLVCYEIYNPGLPFGGTVEPVYDSALRWTTPDRLFRTTEEAEESRAALPRPVTN